MEETVSFAATVVVEDKNAYLVAGGFSWIHWTVANLERNELLENESQSSKDFLQGVNSCTSIQCENQSKELSSFYGGMTPPNEPYLYEIHVYALDCKLNLEKSFYYNELYKKMDGHVLESFTLY